MYTKNRNRSLDGKFIYPRMFNQTNLDKNVFEIGILRVMLVSLVYIVSILALKYSNFTNYFSISLISPLFYCIFQNSMEKEKISKIDKKSIYLTLLAVVFFLVNAIIERNIYNVLGILLSLASSFLISTTLFLVKKFNFHIYVFLFLVGCVLVTFSLFYIPINDENFEEVDGFSIVILVLIGISQFFYHYFSLKSFEKGLSNINEYLVNFFILSAFFYAYFLFNEVLTIMNILGGIVIIGMNIYRNYHI